MKRTAKKPTKRAEGTLTAPLILVLAMCVIVPLARSNAFTRFFELKWELLNLLTIAVVCTLLARKNDYITVRSWTTLAKGLTACIVIGLSVSLAYNRHDAVVRAFRILLMLGLFASVRHMRPSFKTALAVAVTSVSTAAAVAALGPLVVLFTGNTTWRGWYPTFANPNLTAQYLNAVAPLAVMLPFVLERRSHRRIAAAAAVGMGVFLLFTRARGAILGTCAGIAFAALLAARSTGRLGDPRIKKAVAAAAATVVVVMAVLTVTVVPKMMHSKREMLRPHLWSRALRMFSTHPVLGVGPGNFPVAFGHFDGYRGKWAPPPQNRVQYAHNDYLHTLAETGMAGFAVMAWIVLSAMILLWRGAPGMPSTGEKMLAAGFGGGSAAVLVHAMFSFPFIMPASAMQFWINLGLAAGMIDRRNRNDGKNAVIRLPVPPAPMWKTLCVLLGLAGAIMPVKLLVSDHYTAVAERMIRMGKEYDKILAKLQEGRRAGNLKPLIRRKQRAYYETALKAALKALKFDVNNRSAWFQRAMAESLVDKLEESVKSYRRAIALLPDYHVQFFNLGNVYEAMGKRELALEYLRKAVRVHPRYAAAWARLGDLLYKSGQYVEAADAYRRCAGISEKFRRLWYQAARLYEKAGKKEEARECIRRLLRKPPPPR